MESLFILILMLPLVSFMSICLFGRVLGTYGSMVISVSNIMVAFLGAVVLFGYLSFSTSLYIELWHWAAVAGFDVDFSLRYDGLTSVMFVVVTCVSSCVHIYSCVYMYTDPFLSRFMSFLSLFTFFMLLLVASSNFLVLFLGW